MHMHLACAPGLRVFATSSSSSNAPLFDSSFHPRRVWLIPIFFRGEEKGRKGVRCAISSLIRRIVENGCSFWNEEYSVLFSGGENSAGKLYIHAVIFPLAGQSQRNVCRGQITIYFVYFTIIRPPSKSLEDGFVDSFDTLFDWTAFLDRTNPSNVRVTDAPRCNLRDRRKRPSWKRWRPIFFLLSSLLLFFPSPETENWTLDSSAKTRA